MTEQERQGGWTTIPSSPICIMGAEKWRNHKTEGEKHMKKFLMVLLSVAFVLNLAIVIGLIGGYGSPRRALYTITDELMNSAYRFKRGWQFKNSLPWLFRRWTGCLSIFFLYTGVVQKRQKFFCNSVKRQNFTQRIAVIVVLCYNEQRRRMNCA